MIYRLLIYCILLLAVFPVTSFTQDEKGRYTLEEVKLETKLLEAQRERLLGEFESAEKKLLALTEQLPNESTVYYELGLVRYELKKPKEALDAFGKAIELDPTNEWFYQARANVAEEQEEFSIAAASYAELYTLFPKRTNYAQNWALMLLKDEKPDEALTVLEKVEVQIGVTAEISEKKHLIYDILGKQKKAIEEIKTLIIKYPRNRKYRIMLVNYFEKIDDSESAIAELERFVVDFPEDERAKIMLMRAKNEQGTASSPLRDLNSYIESENVSLDDKMKEMIPYVIKFSETKDQSLGDELLVLAESLASQYGEKDEKVCALRGDIFYYMGMYEQAQEQYQISISTDNTNYMVWEQWMFTLQELKDFKSLLKASEEASDLFPNKASALYFQSLALFKKGKNQTSIRLLDQAKIIAGSDNWLKARILVLSGEVYVTMQNKEQAIQAWEEAIAIGYQDPELKLKVEQLRNQN